MKKFDEINIIPFIDIMLVLLAIVLITASFITQGKIQVNIPQASTTQAVQADELAKLITIDQHHQFFYNDQPIDKAQLAIEIANWDKVQKVTVKVDAAVPFETFVGLADMLAANEIKNVAIVTQKSQ